MRTLALIYGSHLDLLRGDFRAARSKSQEAFNTSEDHGLFYSSVAKLLLGWSDVMASTERSRSGGLPLQADRLTVSDGIRALQEGLEEAERTGHRLACAPYCSALAEGYALNGETAKAIQLLDKTLENSRKTQEAFWDAELWRVRGTLLRSLGSERDAEARNNFEKARRIAHRQGTRSFESRAIQSLEEAGFQACP